MFLNEGEGRFRNITEAAGITNDRWGTSAAFLDYDRDGWIDIYVANDGHGSMGLSVGDLNGDGLPDILVTNLDGESNAAYTSHGTGGGFEDTSLASGIFAASFGLTVTKRFFPVAKLTSS